MRDEEEEALRLQREAAAALRPEDYGQSEGSSEEEDSESEEESGEPLGASVGGLGGIRRSAAIKGSVGCKRAQLG